MKEAETFRDKMSSVQKWMIRLQLPHELRVKIRQYYAEASGYCTTLIQCAALLRKEKAMPLMRWRCVWETSV